MTRLELYVVVDVSQDGCVHLYSGGANAGRWNDADCSRRLGWVCESNRCEYISLTSRGLVCENDECEYVSCVVT